MGRYRKIDTRIWNDGKFRRLSDDGKLAFFFLLTHPHMTSLGAMRATIPGLASEIGWPVRRLTESLSEAFRKGIAEHDSEASFVCLPNFLKYNGPESPNVVKSWADSLDLIPECRGKAVLLQRVKGFAEALPEAFAKALPEAFRKGMPNQEPEQEPEQEQEQKQDTPKPPAGDSVFFEEFWKTFPDRRKGGKRKAAEAFQAACKRSDAATIIAAAKEYAASEVGRGEYCKGPVPWLNQDCWDDSRVSWNPTKQKPVELFAEGDIPF